jgi:hypothetical protein
MTYQRLTMKSQTSRNASKQNAPTFETFVTLSRDPTQKMQPAALDATTNTSIDASAHQVILVASPVVDPPHPSEAVMPTVNFQAIASSEERRLSTGSIGVRSGRSKRVD